MNTPQLVMFHPSPFMVEPLNALLAEAAPKIRYENLVVPDLLERASRNGISLAIRQSMREIIESVPQTPPRLIMCCCSTLGGCAEEMQQLTKNRILRIDRPMAEAAVAIGGRIGVAAALKSTFRPTTDLLNQVAQSVSRQIELVEYHCSSAWERKENGDAEGYIDEIVATLNRAKDQVDVIVLAQGSMAQAASGLSHLGIPVLSSPKMAIEAAVKFIDSYLSGL